MAKVLVNESSLTGIANAIRGKNGSTTTYKPSEMAAAITAISGGAEPVIEALSVTSNGTYTAPDGVDGYSPITVNVPQDGSPPDKAFVISGNCEYRFANDGWTWFIEQYGDKITTKDISNAQNMFFSCYNLGNIPFEINMYNGSTYHPTTWMFRNCNYLESIPKINNCIPYNFSSSFYNCYRLRNFPNDFGDWFDWSYLESQTNGYVGNMSSIFQSCYSLRSTPNDFLKHGNPNATYSYTYFYSGFSYCASLDELVNLPIPYTATLTSNAFSNTFNSCYRLKNMTFALNNGQPHIMNWKSQTIDLSAYVGWVIDKSNILNYNSGITADKEVTDDATYQALKNDADWFTTKVEYSRYNHDSAVATINSLPDTSAYLASAGGTNTIKFKGAAGSATDGGAISSLTPDEIAVATAKGWTITLV